MSKTNRRKHVMRELNAQEFELPKDNQKIVKVLLSNGNNLHKVMTPEKETYLVSMPMKFRKNIWTKRGGYVLVEPIAEGKKVKGEIVRILDKLTIKHFKENNVWPKEFDNDQKEEESQENEDIFVNPNIANRLKYYDPHELDSSDSEYSSDGEGLFV